MYEFVHGHFCILWLVYEFLINVVAKFTYFGSSSSETLESSLISYSSESIFSFGIRALIIPNIMTLTSDSVTPVIVPTIALFPLYQPIILRYEPTFGQKYCAMYFVRKCTYGFSSWICPIPLFPSFTSENESIIPPNALSHLSKIADHQIR